MLFSNELRGMGAAMNLDVVLVAVAGGIVLFIVLTVIVHVIETRERRRAHEEALRRMRASKNKER